MLAGFDEADDARGNAARELVDEALLDVHDEEWLRHACAGDDLHEARRRTEAS